MVYFIISYFLWPVGRKGGCLMTTISTKSLILRGIGLVVLALVGWFLNWLFTPAGNIQSVGLWWYIILMALIGVVVFAIAEHDESSIGTIICVIIAALAFVGWSLWGFFSSEIVNAKKYAALIEVADGNFDEDIQRLDYGSQMILLDMGTAKQLGQRSVGNLKNLSWYEINEEYNLVRSNGEYYRISPLEWSDFIKAFNNSKIGLPAYVTVNAMVNQARTVELEENMKYTPNSLGQYNLKRHLRNNYSSYIFDNKYQFEVDDDGTPYYIASVMEPTIGLFGGKVVKSFVLVNAVTGKCQEYSPEEIPSWVDHAYSLSYLMDLAEWHYKYQDGYWNTWFSENNVYKTSYQYKSEVFAGYTSVLINGEVCFVTGLVSARNDESLTGFLTLNPRTGEIVRYGCVGAEESSGQSAAEALVQNYRYSASFPIVVNVDGQETYFMTLKDKTLNNKAFAFVNVRDYTKAVQADNLKDALTLYKQKIGTLEETELEQNQPTSETPEGEVELVSKEGEIVTLYEAIKSGNTNYFFSLEGDETLYVSSIENSDKQVTMKVGDIVEISYFSATEEGVGIVKKITIK